MHITFGWSYDGARWSNTTTPSTLGRVTVGPATLVDILATRFALTRPEVDGARRMLAYRSALVTVVDELDAAAAPGSSPWPVASTRIDPWAVAQSLLTWRDELIQGGWDPASAGAQDEIPERLGVLARIEAQLPARPGWAPGSADALREVDAVITELTATGAAWPTGIDAITVVGERSSLPRIWRRIFDGLEVLGVEITENVDPTPLAGFVIMTSDTEWDAAPATARMLQDLSEAGRKHTVLSTQSTSLLDRELVRIGESPIGVNTRHSSPLSDVIPVFLRAMTKPYDVHALVDLLNISIPVEFFEGKDVAPCETHGEDGFIDGHQDCDDCANYDAAPSKYHTMMFPIIPIQLHHRLTSALNEQPGIGGPAWMEAVEKALERVDDPVQSAQIREFDQLIRTTPLEDHPDTEDHDGGYDTALIETHLLWLTTQLARYNRDGNDATQVIAQVDRVIDLITEMGAQISAQELDQIITAVTDTGGLSVRTELSEHRDVVTNPGQLGGGTAQVIWWLPVDDTPVLNERLRPAESAWLEQTGVDLPSRESIARLTLDSQLRALHDREHITVILPSRVGGETASEHPTLAFLRHNLKRQGYDVASGSAELTAGQSLSPEPMPLTPPDPLYREFTPNDSLLPSSASYSQWEKLLLHPLEWLLGRRLGIEGGSLADVPSGNRMVGTWLHAVVEDIVNGQLADNDGEPVTVHTTGADVQAKLADSAPHYASELLLPGRQRELATFLSIAERSINGLFTALADAGIRVRAVEGAIDAKVTGCRGADDELPLKGFRDMDVIMADGTPGVIDLKYTFSKKKYRELIESGMALQLAVYAKSVAVEHDLTTLADVPVAYFSLHGNRFDTSDARFFESESTAHGEVLEVSASDSGGADTDELWQRAVAGLNAVIVGFRKGQVTDLGNLVNRADWQQFEKPKKGESPASPFDDEETEAFQSDLEWVRTHGFFPEDNAKHTEFSIITGAAGDFA
ncbi:MAG TPA: PD-(D/E)XK nuclease family protein [Candidatus Corynebacterium avicola]|uniref:PD-(D/E)XK nuclease family protein n=1 Tax=Candidatus Corynebacterium avicola TaxID=2838527 RepID=A0A9D1UM83_9CORY|nr:PD-(D/E)XK nuclease family protein [Candidatus Corynebacterium avicola]